MGISLSMEPLAVTTKRASKGITVPLAAEKKLNAQEGEKLYYGWDSDKEAIWISKKPGVMA